MKLCIVLILLLLGASCQARTLIVDPGGSGDAKTLLSAIFLAGNGDTIQILPGDYEGAIVDKSVNISGTGGTGTVNVDGSLAVTAPGCRVSGITIKAREKNACISLASQDNKLVHCTVTGIATAVKVTGMNNSIKDCQIESPQGVEIFGAKFACVDKGFGNNKPVDVVIRPEDIDLVKPENGTLQGVVTHLIFKGVHYEMEVTTPDGYEWLVHSTDMFPVGQKVGIHVDPFDIQIMNKPESEDEEAVGVNE